MQRVIGRAIAGCILASSFLACDRDTALPIADDAGVVAPPRDFKSGTRLRARYHVVDGAVDVFIGWHDAQLGMDCAFEDENGAASVGPGASSYCFPAGLARHREKTGPFLDAACTVRAALTPMTGPATHVLVEPNNACTTAPVVHVARPPVVRGVFTGDGKGGCTSAGFTSAQALGDMVPEGTFVRVVEETEARASRMAARVQVGDDGSRHVVGGFDLARAEPSRVGTTPDGVSRWLPARTAFVGGGELLFSDAACSVSAGSKIGRTATCPLSATLFLEGTCGMGSYVALGEPLTTVFRRDAEGACVSGPALDVLAFQLGAPIPADEYAPVVSTEIGTSRARRRGAGTSTDAPVAWTAIVDATTNEPCEVVTTKDGTLRCLPASSVIAAFFADADCTSPAFARPMGCEDKAPPRFVRDSFEAPVKAYETVRELDAIYERTEMGCAPFAPSVPSRIYEVREVDVSSFPPAVLKQD
ncbi:MAG: hypothetical protein JWP87_4104 [Labilithrix sp.]|nr:hypothetical protein [Labilithrix sp.]